jgi:hypothetical protein
LSKISDDLKQQLAATSHAPGSESGGVWEITPEQIDHVSGGLPPFQQGNIFFDCPGSSFGQDIGRIGGPMFNQGTPPTNDIGINP